MVGTPREFDAGAHARRSSAGWGGRRVGAGRPKKTGRRNSPHIARPPHRSEQPVHVTMRAAVRSLRSQFLFPTVRGVIAATNRARRDRFRVCHFSVQGDHVHLIVEASDRRALVAGMRSLAARMASWINRLLMRSGPVVADRWYGRALETPRSVRRVLVYVLANFRKHLRSPNAALDVFSSAPYFHGFREFSGEAPHLALPRLIPAALAPPLACPIANARTQLLSTAWKRAGLISIKERPLASSTLANVPCAYPHRVK
jgi:REP element-mobilizing transposase RayT